MQEYLPFDYFYLANCYYFIVSLPSEVQQAKYQEPSTPQQFSQNPMEIMENFVSELKFRHQNSYIKEWTFQEDRKLLHLGRTCHNWKELSKQFLDKSAKVCHRRYKKLIQKQCKWPKEDEQMIKYLRQVQKKSWVQIQLNLKKYKAKKIRERYKNYLQIQVNRKKWTLDEDLDLWSNVKQNGKAWKQISQKFPQRSSLQLRNRYYKFLQPAFNKVTVQISAKAVLTSQN